MKIKIRLREVLEDRNISQRELARMMGIRHPSVH
ncbi:helix-turn-helix domain-containing protein [Paenibacillus sp. A3]